MRAQLEHQLALMKRDNVELHLMPITVAIHDGLDGDFLLQDFDEAQRIGYIEYPTGNATKLEAWTIMLAHCLVVP